MTLLRVTHYQRKPRAVGNYSLETIFDDVRTRLGSEVDIRERVAPCLSNGLWRRAWIAMDAGLCQSDILHITGDITFAALFARRRKCVVTILDCIGADGRTGIAGWIFRNLWFRLPARRSRIVTTISEASKRDIVRISGCSPEKVVVIGVAISPLFQRQDRKFNSACPRILQIGAAPNKNIERLAAAIAKLPCTLVVVGEMNASQKAALQNTNVDFTNHTRLSPQALVEQYNHADIIAFASTFEGFGMPILEGNAVGRPVLTGNCTSMPEVAGDAACIVDPFDVVSIRSGLVQIVEDIDYRKQLVENGFKNARRFDPDEIANQYLRVYHRVASLNQRDI